METNINKPVKFNELNDNQKKVYTLIQEETDNYIGGYENQLDDTEEGTEEYNEAYNVLHNTSREEKIDYIMGEVRCSSFWRKNENLHFVTLEWVKERIRRRLIKYGY